MRLHRESAHHACQRATAGRRRPRGVVARPQPLRFSAHRGRLAAPTAAREVKWCKKHTGSPTSAPSARRGVRGPKPSAAVGFIARRRRLHGNGSSHCFRNGRLGCRQKLNMKFIATAEFLCPPARGPARDVLGGWRADLAHLCSVTGLAPRDVGSWRELDPRKERLLPPLPDVLRLNFNVLLRRQHGTRGRLHARVHAPRAGVGRPAEEVEAFQSRAIGHSPPAASVQKGVRRCSSVSAGAAPQPCYERLSEESSPHAHEVKPIHPAKPLSAHARLRAPRHGCAVRLICYSKK